MNIEATSTLEILMIGDSVTEIEETIYAEAIVLETPIVDELAARRLAKMDAEFAKRVVIDPVNWPMPSPTEWPGA